LAGPVLLKSYDQFLKCVRRRADIAHVEYLRMF